MMKTAIRGRNKPHLYKLGMYWYCHMLFVGARKYGMAETKEEAYQKWKFYKA